jgi:hypothetical protein
MPRIPSREEPYHSVAKCNRHWKTKREFVTKAANKASHVDGSHYLLVCVTPKGNIEVHASEHFYDDSNQQRTDGVINWDVLRKRASSIQSKNEERWAEVERQEKRFGQEGDEDEDGEDDEEGSVGASLTDIKVEDLTASAAVGPGQLMSTFSAAKLSPARPINSVMVTPHSLEKEYCNRFANLGQSVCANILKAWIKVVEPKKQTKYPYKDKKGNEGRPPPWWPRGMRHIEPDHLHKEERPRLLASIIQQASAPRGDRSPPPTSPENRELTISRLHFATAEIGSSIPPRQHYELRQIYLIAKEVRKANEDRLRGRSATKDSDDGAWSEIIVDIYEKPAMVSGSSVSGPLTKRGFEHDYDTTSRLLADKENIDFSDRPMKRTKLDLHHVSQQALTPLQSHQNVYSAVHYVEQPHTPHTATYGGWPTGVAPIAVPQPAATTQATSNSSSTLSSGQQQQAQAQQQQQQQQQSYYRGFMDVNSHQYSSTTAGSTPTPTAASYPYQGYAYQPVAYQGYSGYQASQTPSTGTATSNSSAGTAQYANGYYDQGQAFVGDLAGLSA